jgi:hypothetical protein
MNQPCTAPYVPLDVEIELTFLSIQWSFDEMVFSFDKMVKSIMLAIFNIKLSYFTGQFFSAVNLIRTFG